MEFYCVALLNDNFISFGSFMWAADTANWLLRYSPTRYTPTFHSPTLRTDTSRTPVSKTPTSQTVKIRWKQLHILIKTSLLESNFHISEFLREIVLVLLALKFWGDSTTVRLGLSSVNFIPLRMRAYAAVCQFALGNLKPMLIFALW